MGHAINITLSRGLRRNYNKVSYSKGEDVVLKVDLSNFNSDWKNDPYNITVYDDNRATLQSQAFSTDEITIVLNDLTTDTKKGEIVIEDRTDPDNIDIKQRIAYLLFIEFKGGVVAEVAGHFNYLENDGSNTQIPYRTTGFPA